MIYDICSERLTAGGPGDPGDVNAEDEVGARGVLVHVGRKRAARGGRTRLEFKFEGLERRV